MSLISKSALRLRQPGTADLEATVADFTRTSDVEIIDLAQWFPGLDRANVSLSLPEYPK